MYSLESAWLVYLVIYLVTQMFYLVKTAVQISYVTADLIVIARAEGSWQSRKGWHNNILGRHASLAMT